MLDEIVSKNVTELTVFSAVSLVMVAYAASRGSLASIKSQWHEETIYSQYIRPFAHDVTSIPLMVSLAFSLVLLLGLIAIGVPNMGSANLNMSIRSSISIPPAYFIAYGWSKHRGKRIYGHNIKFYKK